MRVPYSTQQNTRPSDQPLTYLRAATPDLSPIEQGLGNLEQGLRYGVRQQKIAADEAQAKQDQMDRFKAEEAFIQHETDSRARADEIIKDAPLNDTNLPDRANADFATYNSKFISDLPPQLQEEFKVKTAELGQRVDNAAKKAQDEKNAKYFGNVVTDASTQAQIKVEADPKTYKQNADQIDKLIDSTSWDQAAKDEAKRKNHQQLASPVYRQQVEENLKAGVPVNGDARDKQLAFAAHELNTTESSAGTRLRSATTIEQAVDAGLAFERPSIPARENRLRNARDVLAGHAPSGAMKAFNYFQSQGYTPVQAAGFVGSLMQESGLDLNPGAANPKDPGTSVGIGQWNGPRKAEMLKFTGGAIGVGPDMSIDQNPMFNSIPYEDRVALRKDAAANVNALITQQHQQQVSQEAALTNDTLMGIATDKKGYDRTYVENLQQSGQISDYDNYKKMTSLLDQKEADGLSARNFSANLAGTSAFDPHNTENIKGFNDWVGKPGLAAINNKDQAYINNTLMPVVARTGMIPTDVSGLLDGMMRSTNPDAQLFAVNALLNMEKPASASYLKLDESLRNRVDKWNSLKGVADPEQLANILRDNKTPEQRKAYEGLYVEAEKALTDNTSPYYLPFSLVLQSFNTGGILGVGQTTAQLPDIKSAALGMENEFRAMFKENYATMNGNQKAAFDVTMKELNRTWGVSQVGGNIVLMKYPPEKTYKGQTVNGNYYWMSAQAREEMQLPANQKVEFISDGVTKDNLDNHKPASYLVATQSEYGDWIIPDPLHRQTFEITPQLLAAADLNKNYQNDVQRIRDLELQIRAVPQDMNHPAVVPQDLTDQLKELRAKVASEYKGLSVVQDKTPNVKDLQVDPISEDRSKWDKRSDGSVKGNGFLGLLKRPDGGVSSEISISTDVIGGKEFPLLVPTLTRPEIDKVLALDPSDPKFFEKLPSGVVKKAEEYAIKRVRLGKSPFASPQESPIYSSSELAPQPQLGEVPPVY